MGKIEVGDIVRIGQRFEMGERVGQGRMVNDDHTGRICTVVSVTPAHKDIPESAVVAYGEAPAADYEGDLDIVTRRLELVRRPLFSEWEVAS